MFTETDWYCAREETGTSAEVECQKFTGTQDDSELTTGLKWQSVKRTFIAVPRKGAVPSIPYRDEVIKSLKEI